MSESGADVKLTEVVITPLLMLWISFRIGVVCVMVADSLLRTTALGEEMILTLPSDSLIASEAFSLLRPGMKPV